jgi:hypothetical protein
MQIFHVVPDKECRDNHLLAIGSDAYNKIRYRAGFRGSIPGWISNLKRDLLQKQNGTFVSERKESGRILSPAAAGLRRDFKDCVYTNLHFKSKTFEYNATTYEFKVNGKYVATLDFEKGVVGHFSIQYINDKYSRYRLRDLGIRLISKDGKTFWKFGVEKGYYDYLMSIHGSLANLRKFFKPVFPTIKVEKKGDIDEELIDYVIVFVCELRNDIKYPVCPSAELHSFYVGGNSSFGYVSGIFHNYKEEYGSISKVDTKSESYKSSERFTTELNNILLVPEQERIYHLKMLLTSSLQNFNIIIHLNRSLKNRSIWTYSTYGVDISMDTLKREVKLEDKNTVVVASFDELEIDRYFKGDKLVFIPESTWELVQLKDECTAPDTLTINVNTEEGLIPLPLHHRFFRTNDILEKLVGKELLIG